MIDGWQLVMLGQPWPAPPVLAGRVHRAHSEPPPAEMLAGKGH